MATTDWETELQHAQLRLEEVRLRASQMMEDAVLARNRVIRAACREGVGMADIGRMVGITRERIRQICDGEDLPV